MFETAVPFELEFSIFFSNGSTRDRQTGRLTDSPISHMQSEHKTRYTAVAIFEREKHSNLPRIERPITKQPKKHFTCNDEEHS